MKRFLTVIAFSFLVGCGQPSSGQVKEDVVRSKTVCVRVDPEHVYAGYVMRCTFEDGAVCYITPSAWGQCRWP